MLSFGIRNKTMNGVAVSWALNSFDTWTHDGTASVQEVVLYPVRGCDEISYSTTGYKPLRFSLALLLISLVCHQVKSDNVGYSSGELASLINWIKVRFDSSPHDQNNKIIRSKKTMGFNSFHEKPTSPAKVYSRWRGGEGKLTHWDGSVQNPDGSLGSEIEEKLPFKFAILEQSRRISGFAPGKQVSTRFYSNETVAYDDVITVMSKTGDAPAQKILEGKYADIKEKLPQGAKLAIQLYVYVLERDQVECITCQGASLGAFIEYSKKNRIYDNFTVMEKGEEAVTGTVHYFPPKFGAGEGYDKETRDKLSQIDAEIAKYLKSVHDSNETSVSIDEIDQTPKQYDGEQSQEPAQDDNTQAINFNEIPF